MTGVELDIIGQASIWLAFNNLKAQTPHRKTRSGRDYNQPGQSHGMEYHT